MKVHFCINGLVITVDVQREKSEVNVQREKSEVNVQREKIK